MEIPAADLVQIKDRYIQGLYLQAYAQGQAFGDLRTWTGPAARLLAGRLAIQLGAPILGRRLHLLAYRESPAYPEVIYYHARYRLERFGPLSCWQFMQQHPDWSESSPELRADWLALAGYVASRFRDFARAERYFAEADALAADRAWINVERSGMLEADDRLDEALAALRRSLELQPWFRPAVQAMAHLLLRQGKALAALEFLQEAVENLESGIIVAHLATVQLELGYYKEARESLDHYAELSPLMEAESAKWLAARRSDVSYFLGEFAEAAKFARAVEEPFYLEFAERLANWPESQPCQPTRHILTAELPAKLPTPVGDLLRDYWKKQQDKGESPSRKADESPPPSVEQSAEPPSEDAAGGFPLEGLPDAKERRRLEQAGWKVVEFRVTLEIAEQLISRGVPFLVTLVEPGFTQTRLAIGCDPTRDSLYLLDGNERSHSEAPFRIIKERYGVFGPMGMAAVPACEAGRLEGLLFPDREGMERLYQLQCQLIDRHFDAAERALRDWAAASPNERLLKWASFAFAKATWHPMRQLESLDRLLAESPQQPALLLMKSVVFRELGRSSERLELLQQAGGRADSDPLIAQTLAQTLLSDHRRQAEAVRLLRRSLRQRPGAAAGYYLLATYAWEHQQFETAVELYRMAACLDDREEQFAEIYLRCARAVGGPAASEAMRLYQNRATRGVVPNTLAVRMLFSSLNARNEPDLAFSALNHAVEKLQRLQQSAAEPSRAEEIRAGLAELLLFRADQYANRGQFHEAEADLDAAKSLADPILWYKTAARVARARPVYTQSLAAVQEVMKRDPLNIEAHRIAVALLIETQGRKAARSHLGVLCQRYPQFYPLVRLRAEYLYRDPDEAAVLATQHLLDLCPQDAWAWRQLALVYADRKRHDEALHAIRQAANIEPNHPSQFAVLAHVYRRADRMDESLETLKQLVQEYPDHELAISELVQYSRGVKEKQAALKHISEQLHRHSFTGDGLVAYFEQAIRLVQDPEDQERLFADFERFLEERPDVWQCWSIAVQMLVMMHRAPEALSLAEESTRRFPLISKVWLDLAEAAEAAKNSEVRLAALQQAVAVSPGWAPAAKALADWYSENGDIEESLRTLKRAVSLNPLDPWVRWLFAEALWHADRGEEALEEAKNAVRHEPPYDPDIPPRPENAWSAVQFWSERLFQPEAALELAREQTRDRGGDPRVWVRYARTINEIASAPEILAAIDKAIELDPRHVDAYDLKAERLAQLGRFEEALAAARPAVLQDDLPLVLQGRSAWIEARRGNYQQAIPAMQALVAVDPDYLWAWQQLAEWYDETGNSASYLEAAEQLCRLRPDHPVSLTMRGEAKLQVGDREGGKEDLREVLRNYPNYSAAAAILFDACLTDNEPREARTALAVLQEHLTGPEVLVKQLQLAIQLNEPEAASRAFAEICQTPTDGPATWLQLAITQMRNAGWGERAAALMKEAWQSGEEFNPWAAILWQEIPPGENAPLEEKLEAVAAALRQSPDFLAAHDRKAELLTLMGRIEEAMQALQPEIVGDPVPLPLRGRIAWIKARQGERAAAIALMNELLSEEPDYSWGWRQLIHWYDAENRPEDVLEAANQLVRLNPDDPIAHVLRGEARRALGDHRGAKDDFQRAFEADPGFDTAGLQLVGEQLETGDVAAASQTLKALESISNGPMFRYRSIQVAARLGQLDVARNQFRQLGADPSVSRALLRDAASAMGEVGWDAEAEEDLSELTRNGIVTPASAGLWAERLIQTGKDWKVAEELSTLAARNQPAGREVVLVYAWGLVVLGRADNAVATIQRYAELLRGADESWGRAGAILAEAGHFALAAAWLGDWRERSQLDPWVLRPLHDALRAIGRDEEAEALLREVAARYPLADLSPDFRAWLAILAIRSREITTAKQYLRSIDQLGLPDGIKLLCAMAAALLAVVEASPAEKARVFADAREDLWVAAQACASADVPPGAGRMFKEVVKCIHAEVGTLSSRWWAWRQQIRPWVRG